MYWNSIKKTLLLYLISSFLFVILYAIFVSSINTEIGSYLIYTVLIFAFASVLVMALVHLLLQPLYHKIQNRQGLINGIVLFVSMLMYIVLASCVYEPIIPPLFERYFGNPFAESEFYFSLSVLLSLVLASLPWWLIIGVLGTPNPPIVSTEEN